jgi:hypothetical protein
MDDFMRQVQTSTTPPYCWTWVGPRRHDGTPVWKTDKGWVRLSANRLGCPTCWCVHPGHAIPEEA